MGVFQSRQISQAALLHLFNNGCNTEAFPVVDENLPYALRKRRVACARLERVDRLLIYALAACGHNVLVQEIRQWRS